MTWMRHILAAGGAAVAALLLAGPLAHADEVLLNDGRKFTGTVTRQTEQLVEIRTDDGEVRSFPIGRVRQVTRDGAEPPAADEPSADEPPKDDSPADKKPRTPGQIKALIDEAGKSKPPWWDETKLTIPPALDLTWAKPAKGWDHNRWLGQYIWDIINPNPSRWREGAKLLHHTLTVNKDNRDKLQQSMGALAGVYQRLLGDWARAAYWLQRAKALKPLNTGQVAELAECYYRLGSKALARETLDGHRYFNGRTIKLIADMGDLKGALAKAKSLAEINPDLAYVLAGDACRRNGDVAQAIRFYEKVVALGKGSRGLDNHKKRARANLEALRLFEGFAASLAALPDGSYESESPGYAGPVRVAVTVKEGKIESVKVVRHREKQFYSSIEDTIGQIVAGQTVNHIDTTAGATITSEAIINATAKAVAQGKQP